MRRFLALLPILLAAPLAWVLEQRGREAEVRQSKAVLDQASDAFIAGLKGRMDRIRQAQADLVAALTRRPGASETDWEEMTTQVGAGSLPGLRFIHVIHRLRAADLPAFERILRASYPKARVWDVHTGHDGPLGKRDLYYPVRLCFPHRDDALGMDQASRLESWSDLYLPAEQERQPQLGGPIRTVFYPDRVAVLLAQPTGAAEGDPRVPAFVTVVLDLNTLTDGLAPGFAWTLHEGRTAHPTTLLAQGAGAEGTWESLRTLPMLNRVWTLRTRGGWDPAAAAAHRRLRQGLGLLLAGAMGLSGLLWIRAVPR